MSSSIFVVITEWMAVYFCRLESRCNEVCGLVNSNTDNLCERWMCELESGGNVKFTTGDPSLPWFKSCSDLTNSRFSIAEVQVRRIEMNTGSFTSNTMCVCVCVSELGDQWYRSNWSSKS